MATLYATYGLPASGKSTWARRWAAAAPGRATCSRDSVRAALGLVSGAADPGRPGSDEHRVTAEQHHRIADALLGGQDAAADDTNLWPGSLERLAALAARCGADFVVVDFSRVPPEVCRARNASRNGRGRVPDEAMDKMVALLRPLAGWTVIQPALV